MGLAAAICTGFSNRMHIALCGSFPRHSERIRPTAYASGDMHRVYVGDLDLPPLETGQVVALEGDEAAHLSRVKRLGEGDAVALLDGCGREAEAVIVDEADAGVRGGAVAGGEWGRDKAEEPKPTAFGERVDRRKLSTPRRHGRAVFLRVQSVRLSEPLSPRVELWTAVPKGGRVDDMVDQLSQVGASAWVPMQCARSVVEPREHKLDRLRRIAVESAKQCVRPWLMEIAPIASFADAFQSPVVRGLNGGESSGRLAVVLADARGVEFDPKPVLSLAKGEGSAAAPTTVRVLIGPEGGWEEREFGRIEAERRQGENSPHRLYTCSRFGVHIMRIETAAPVVAGIVINAICKP